MCKSIMRSIVFIVSFFLIQQLMGEASLATQAYDTGNEIVICYTLPLSEKVDLTFKDISGRTIGRRSFEKGHAGAMHGRNIFILEKASQQGQMKIESLASADQINTCEISTESGMVFKSEVKRGLPDFMNEENGGLK